MQFDCKHEIQLPMVDPDGDTLKCRWAVGKECDSICNGVPVATLDEVMTTCIISIKLWKESLDCDVQQFHRYQQNKQSPLHSDVQQFHQYQQNKQSPLNSDVQQFHQYQQNKQSPLTASFH